MRKGGEKSGEGEKWEEKGGEYERKRAERLSWICLGRRIKKCRERLEGIEGEDRGSDRDDGKREKGKQRKRLVG